MHKSPKAKRPPWLIGLLIAIVVVAVVLIIANLLGYGDDPAIGAAAALSAAGDKALFRYLVAVAVDAVGGSV